jgi:hypothetical protein
MNPQELPHPQSRLVVVGKIGGLAVHFLIVKER